MFEKIVNFFNSILDRFEPTEVLTENQQLAFDIFKLCLYDDSNIRLLNSDAVNKKYIVTKSYAINGTVNTFIILQSSPNSNLITIVNHEFKYDISMPNKAFTKMSKMFDKKVEEDREKMEKEIFSNITQSLELVLKQFKEQFQPISNN